MFSTIRRRINIGKRFSTNANKTPSCLSCVHYNPVDSNCYAIKNIPVLNCSCGPDGKQYEYIGPALKKDMEHIRENVYLSVSSLILCKLFVFDFYPPYSMVICVIPLTLTGFYGLVYLEQIYSYAKMEREERQRLIKIKNKKI
jgi:hypothetical protein